MESGYPQRLGSVIKDQRIPVTRSCLYPPGNKLRHQRDAPAKRYAINNKRPAPPSFFCCCRVADAMETDSFCFIPCCYRSLSHHRFVTGMAEGY
ncbi:hypothetical protein CEXT_785671 [Caerostris extrusa]|uniref:Uncharacterized protein n=1 Tax=Caerostris extrusa TaxID=172846 RepID=A0AAV4MI39_CAEEX|nr:hypothetical protein CEXT_785671 [Caerostris extrusa]